MNCFNKVNIPKYKTIEKYEKKKLGLNLVGILIITNHYFDTKMP